jgi:hypothetical protein
MSETTFYKGVQFVINYDVHKIFLYKQNQQYIKWLPEQQSCAFHSPGTCWQSNLFSHGSYPWQWKSWFGPLK